MSYKKGDQIRISLNIIKSGSKADPAGLMIKIKDPTNIISTYQYAEVDSLIIKDSTGNYHFDLSLPQAGHWLYRWEASGAAAGADEGKIYVENSTF